MIYIKEVLNRIILLFSAIIIWELCSRNVNPLFIPEPKIVFNSLVELIKSGQLFIAIMYSFLRISIATFLSGIVAFFIGLLAYNSKIANNIISPIISIMRYIPITAFYPLLIMWFGIDEFMKIVFLFIATFVYMMPSVILCLEEINLDLIDTGLTIGMNRFQIITKIQIPAITPSLMNNFIMMYGIGWTYIAVAETINAKYGLGFIIQQSSSRGRTEIGRAHV